MNRVGRKIIKESAPELAQLLEASPTTPLDDPLPLAQGEISTVEDLLKRIPFFKGMSPEQLSEIARQGSSEEMVADQVIFREGDLGDRLYLLLEGKIAVRREKNGETVTLAELGAGEVFGELALIDAEERSATVVALEKGRLFTLKRKPFHQLLSKSPRMVAMLLVGLSAKIRKNARKVFA